MIQEPVNQGKCSSIQGTSLAGRAGSLAGQAGNVTIATHRPVGPVRPAGLVRPGRLAGLERWVELKGEVDRA